MPAQLVDDERRVLARAKASFWVFLTEVFSKSFDGQLFLQADGSRKPFSLGAVHKEWALVAQLFKDICVLAPRLHLKSTVLGRGLLMWEMFNARGYEDGLYISYKDALANEHLAELGRLIEANPFCRHWVNKKPQAEAILNYYVDWGEGPVAEVEVTGSGIFSATRGKHPRLALIADDILSDFANPLNPTELEHIERIVRSVIMSLPTPDCPMVFVGTPQSYFDILYKLGRPAEEELLEEDGLPARPDFYWDAFPAIVNDKTQRTLWPEVYNWPRLQRVRRRVGLKAFSSEYLLSPVAEEMAFIPMIDLMGIADLQLTAASLETPFRNDANLGVYVGVDVGKVIHPSHLTVLLETPERDLVVIYEEFLDHLKYNAQISRLNYVMNHFKVTRGYYDATYNVLDDRGLTRTLIGKKFSKKLKADVATGLEKRVYAAEGEPGLVLLNHQRFLGQIACVSNKLEAPTTPMGHGDAFWSLALAIKAAEDGPRLIDMGTPKPLTSRSGLAGQLRGM